MMACAVQQCSHDDGRRTSANVAAHIMNRSSYSLNRSQPVLEHFPWHARLLERISSLGDSMLAARRDRPYLALAALPLAMVAATMALWLWLLLPLTALCWYWASSEWRWTWLLGVMEACFGVQWAYIGAYCLATFPEQRILVGALWAAYPLVVAGVAAVSRWQYGHCYGW